jgi:murein DD-endopeptidase MepM/ murein hydrolase activator NlpD
MRRKSFTILILPRDRGRFRQLQLSRNFILVLSLIGVLLVSGALYVPHLLFQLGSQAVSLEKVNQQNFELTAEKDRFETELSRIATRLNQFETGVSRLAAELGVDDLPSTSPARGGAGSGTALGPGHRSILEGDLDALASRSTGLDESLLTLDRVFDNRSRLLAATPNLMPVEGWFSDGFGWRTDPRSSKRQFHRGIDIVADTGTEILASGDGVVSRAIRTSDYGKTVDISHGYGYVTRYAHMSELLVRSGQRVVRGDVIGRVGSTGRSTGPHLHYEVFRDGRRVNPWKYLGQKGR